MDTGQNLINLIFAILDIIFIVQIPANRGQTRKQFKCTMPDIFYTAVFSEENSIATFTRHKFGIISLELSMKLIRFF